MCCSSSRSRGFLRKRFPSTSGRTAAVSQVSITVLIYRNYFLKLMKKHQFANLPVQHFVVLLTHMLYDARGVGLQRSDVATRIDVA